MKKLIAFLMMVAMFATTPMAVAETCEELQCSTHSADTTGPEGVPDNRIQLTELLRVIQFYNVGAYHCAVEGDGESEDGFTPGPGCVEEVELMLTLIPMGGGAVQMSQTGPYSPGEAVTLTAVANEGYEFSYFLIGDDPTPRTTQVVTVTMTADLTVTAVFVPITVEGEPEGNPEGEGEGSVEGEPEGSTEGEADTEAPVITLNGDSEVTLQCGAVYEDAGATVTDNSNEDLTIVVGGDWVDVTTPSIYTVTYNVSDSSGNAAAQKTRTVTVIDTMAPVIILLGSASVEIQQGDTYADAGAVVTDACEGNTLNESIVTTNPVNTATPGVYTVTYNVSDSSGNAAVQKTRTVTVMAPSGQEPEITVEPADQIKEVGQELLLRVTASDPQGSPLSYQWYKDGMVLVEQTSRDLRIDVLSVMDEGIYQCIVSDSEGNETSSRDIVVDVNGQAWLRFTYEAGTGVIEGDLNLNEVVPNSILASGNTIAANEVVVGIQLTLWGGDGLFSERGLIETPLPSNGWGELMTYDGQGVVDGNGASRPNVNLDTWLGNDLADLAFFRVVVENTITGERRDVQGNNDAVVATLNDVLLVKAPGETSWGFTVQSVDGKSLLDAILGVLE